MTSKVTSHDIYLSDMRAEVFDLEEMTSGCVTVIGKGQVFKKKKNGNRKQSNAKIEKSVTERLKRHVPPPEGEIARLTIDVFK